MWQTFSARDLLQSSHMWIQAMLRCGKLSTTMQMRIISRLSFCRRSWKFSLHQFVHKLFWNIHACHELDNLIFFAEWTNLHDRSRDGPMLVTESIDISHSPHMWIYIIVMWVTLQNKDCFDSDFAGTQKPTSGGTLCVFRTHDWSWSLNLNSFFWCQVADILIEGNFTRDKWNNLLHLFHISHFSSTCCAKNLWVAPISVANRSQRR